MNKYFIYIILSCCILFSCGKDFLNTQSTSTADKESMFETTNSSMMAINGIHRLMYKPGSSAAQCGYGTYMLWMDMMGEDLVYTKGNAQWQSQAKWALHRNTGSSHVKFMFGMFYEIIANSNMVIENIDNAEGPQEEKDYIKGQALAYRGYIYFCLVQLWGERYYRDKENSQNGVVLRLESGYMPMARSSVEDVYIQINKDLDGAISLLSNIKIKRATKAHIDVNVARGMKARVLLTQGNWSEAANVAKQVFDLSGAKIDTSLYDRKQGRMCDAASSEWIWGKIGQPTIETGTLTNFYSFISNTNVSYNKNTPRAIYNLLYEKISDTDVRKSIWLPKAPSMPKKDVVAPPSGNIFMWMSQKYIVDYPDNTSSNYAGNVYTADLPLMRLSEMLLIMAEGFARAGKESDAASALFTLVSARDKSYILSSNTGDKLIEEILLHRRIELWGEGFRYLDLKRLNMDLDRGPAPRAGYNQGGAVNDWKTGKTPKNLDPLASNYNMYDDQGLGEENRFKAANSIERQFVFPKSELDYNPLCTQNPI